MARQRESGHERRRESLKLDGHTHRMPIRTAYQPDAPDPCVFDLEPAAVRFLHNHGNALRRGGQIKHGCGISVHIMGRPRLVVKHHILS